MEEIFKGTTVNGRVKKVESYEGDGGDGLVLERNRESIENRSDPKIFAIRKAIARQKVHAPEEPKSHCPIWMKPGGIKPESGKGNKNCCVQ